MDLTLSKEFAHIPDLRHQVRSFHRFRSSFNQGSSLVAHHMGMAVEVDESRSALAFLDWAETIAREKRFGARNSPDACAFSCGLLLAELIRTMPVRLSRDGYQAGDGTLPLKALAIAEFWPEGFLLTSYCASLLDAMLQQDFKTCVTLGPLSTEIRTWWSFRENTQDDPLTAIGFFELFLGKEPAWQHLGFALPETAAGGEAQAALQ